MFNKKEHLPAVERLINSVANSLKVEIVVFDNEANLFCCTPQYLKKKGKAVHEPSIREVLSKGSLLVNTPGKMDSCLGCRFKNNCPSTIELLCCIKASGTVAGVLAITSFTKEGHNKITNNINNYLSILTDISYIIGNIITTSNVIDFSNINESQLETILNLTDDIIIVSDFNGVITNYSSAAIDEFASCQLPSSSLWHILPENAVNQILRGKEFYKKLIPSDNKILKITSNSIKDASSHISSIIVKIEFDNRISTQSTHLNKTIWKSSPSREIYDKILRICNSPTPVLVTGETGTGKEVVARSLHENSSRRDKPFVAINCSSIPESLFESELFGYEEGSFTGAKKGGKIGKIESAQGGTLFLDELGEMPLSFQPKLLRFLQDYEIERVGSVEKIPIDVRIVAATNKNIPEMIENKTFRMDLYYRLSVINIELPPLRERKSDIMPIAYNYLILLKEKIPSNLESFSSEVENIFLKYQWPGNIRELQNVIEYAVNFCDASVLSIDDLPSNFIKTIKNKINPTSESSYEELRKIQDLLDEYGYTLDSKKKIASILGISLRTLYRKLENLK